jgi:hypothetical protein
MKIDKKSVLIGFLSCLCITMFLGFTQKDGNFDTIVANKILIGDKDKPFVEISKNYDGNSGLIMVKDKKGFNGLTLGMYDNHGFLSVNTRCSDNDPDCVSGLLSLSADEFGGLIDIYANGTISAHSIGVSETGGMMELYDIESREINNSLGSNGNGGFFSTYNNAGKMTGYMGTDSEQDGVLGLFDKNGKEYE